MWFIGLVIGGLVGAAIGDLVRWDSAWQLFAALGAVGAILLKRESMTDVVGRLERRVATLERDVTALNAARAAAANAEAERIAVDDDRTQTETMTAAPDAPGSVEPAVAQPHAAAASVASPVADTTIAKAPPVTPPPRTPSRPASEEPNWLWQKLFGGNVLAKIGVVLLLLGIGSGLKLAVDFGFFPAPVRLLLATLAGIAMIAFGLTRVRIEQHRMFGLALQGGGFGVLYLVTYFALARYGYVDHATAFTLFAALGIGCLFLAVRFEGEALAILGISGAFLAPLIASTGSGSHIVLFSFYAVLAVLVLAVNWLRGWRVLTVIALVFTFATGISWASAAFHPQFFASTEAFLVLFAILYSGAPLLSALAGRGSPAHWADSALLFGTPIAAAICQTWLLDNGGLGHVVLAWSAVAAGLYYSTLAAILHARRTTEHLRLAHAAIAAAFYTLAVPLAFGVQVTTAFWAIEGFVLAWYGLARDRRLPYAAGLLLQLGAGAYFAIGTDDSWIAPVLNDIYVGCVVIAACGAATAWITRRGRAAWLSTGLTQVFSAMTGGWALLWWLSANASEIARFAPNNHKIALYTALLIVTAWAISIIGRMLAWPGARYMALLAAGASLLGAIFAGWSSSTQHALHDSMVLALPAAFVSFYFMLRRNEQAGLRALVSEAHVYGLLLLTVTLLREALWLAERLAPNVELWNFVAWQLVPSALVLISIHLDRNRAWPVKDQRGAYLLGGALPLLCTALGVALLANVLHDGGGSPAAYLPFASFFDVAQIAVILTAWAWATTAGSLIGPRSARLARLVPAALGFIWLSAMAMRLAHHWAGVPFEADALIQSGVAQSMLSVLWTALALAVMIRASAGRLRREWFVGFALLGIVGAKFVLIDVINEGTVTWTLSLIGVGLLILAASYFSPAPPRSIAGATS